MKKEERERDEEGTVGRETEVGRWIDRERQKMKLYTF